MDRASAGALRDCHSLTFHVTNGDWVYEGGGSGAGVSVSRNAGATWKQPKDGLARHYGWVVAADPARPEVWYASVAPSPLKENRENNAQAAIVRSVGGAPWQPLTGGLPQPLNHNAVCPAHRSHNSWSRVCRALQWRGVAFDRSWRLMAPTAILFGENSLHAASSVIVILLIAA